MNLVVKILQPSGILDSVKGKELRQEISTLLESHPDVVLLDLQDISFMDSSGLGALLSTLKMVRMAGGKLFICSVNDQIKMLFELTKMNRVLPVYANQEEFKNSLLESK